MQPQPRAQHLQLALFPTQDLLPRGRMCVGVRWGVIELEFTLPYTHTHLIQESGLPSSRSPDHAAHPILCSR